jgi:hypothetical protein
MGRSALWESTAVGAASTLENKPRGLTCAAPGRRGTQTPPRAPSPACGASLDALGSLRTWAPGGPLSFVLGASGLDLKGTYQTLSTMMGRSLALS